MWLASRFGTHSMAFIVELVELQQNSWQNLLCFMQNLQNSYNILKNNQFFLLNIQVLRVLHSLQQVLHQVLTSSTSSTHKPRHSGGNQLSTAHVVCVNTLVGSVCDRCHSLAALLLCFNSHRKRPTVCAATSVMASTASSSATAPKRRLMGKRPAPPARDGRQHQFTYSIRTVYVQYTYS